MQKLENTDYTREHDAREDKASGLGKLNSADDVFKRERGNSTQLTELFIAMARAAGMQADAMLVPDRSKEVFLSQWLNFDQFDDLIAIVNVDGKDVYFDPGERYCALRLTSPGSTASSRACARRATKPPSTDTPGRRLQEQHGRACRQPQYGRNRQDHRQDRHGLHRCFRSSLASQPPCAATTRASSTSSAPRSKT